MLIARLIRLITSDQGTVGRLTTDGFSCYTIELPWRDNAPQISCIPKGEYHVVWSKSPRMRKWTYEILNVAGRGGIRMHSGNYAGDRSRGYLSSSLGCPILGKTVGKLQNQTAVLCSRPTVAAFEKHMGKKPFTLVIE